MICKNCGSIIKDGDKFCFHCGVRIETEEVSSEPKSQDIIEETEANDTPFADAVTDEPPAPYITNQETPPRETACTAAPQYPGKRKRPVLYAFEGVVLLIAAVVIVLLSIKQSHYKDATALFDEGSYAQAAAEFEALGGFKNSAELASLSERWADYTKAVGLIEDFDHDDTAEAEDIFLSLGTFEDAAELAEFCQNSLDYEAAAALESGGEYDQALAAFEALGTFSDSEDHVRACSDELDYAAAMALMDKGSYAAAAEKLAAPAESKLRDSVSQLNYCNKKVAYAEAEQSLADGENYSAYKTFITLGQFEDAADRALECILDAPKNGQVYRNENYPARQADLKVVNSYDMATYLKLYSDNGDLVCTFYISANKTATVHVPAGTYILKRAFGTDWFGLNDMFGDDGYYYLQRIGDSYEFEMEKNYIYTLSSSGGSGTPVSDSTTSRDGF